MTVFISRNQKLSLSLHWWYSQQHVEWTPVFSRPASTRKTISPPCDLANSQLNNAVRAPPTCNLRVKRLPKPILKLTLKSGSRRVYGHCSRHLSDSTTLSWMGAFAMPSLWGRWHLDASLTSHGLMVPLCTFDHIWKVCLPGSKWSPRWAFLIGSETSTTCMCDVILSGCLCK